MKLELKIRRPGGTHVDMPNPDESTTAYHFAPLDPTRADSPHVCEVSNMTHFARFIAVAPDCYVPFEGKAPTVELAKPADPKAREDKVAFDPATDEMTVVASIPHAEAAALPSWASLQAGIKAGTFSQEQLREWMAAEEDAATPRPGYIAAIVKALT